MEINNISALYSNMVSDTAEKEKTSKLSSLSGSDLSTASDKELMDACKDFESYFVEQMFKEMKKTVPTTEETTGSSSTMLDYFEGDLLKEYADSATNTQSLGMAQMLFEQMKRNYDV